MAMSNPVIDWLVGSKPRYHWAEWWAEPLVARAVTVKVPKTVMARVMSVERSVDSLITSVLAA